jgi:amino acid transporter
LDQIVPAAQKAGFEYGGTSSLSATLSAVALLISMPGLAFLWTYFGGEVRRTRTTSLVITLSSVVLSCGIVALIAWQANRVFGSEFQAAAYYLSSNGSSDYPLAAFPFVNVFFAVLTGSTVLAAIIGVAFAAGTLAAPFAGILMVTRGMFAYSFDRMLPAKLAEVNPRTHTPVNALVVTGVLMALFAAGFVYTSALFNDFIVALGVEICVVTMLTSLAGAILPYRRPDLYELSPTRRVVLGIPLITWLGVLGIIVYGVYLWVLLDQVPATTRGYLFVGGMYALGALIAIWAYLWHRRSGVQLYAALRDLPPE